MVKRRVKDMKPKQRQAAMAAITGGGARTKPIGGKKRGGGVAAVKQYPMDKKYRRLTDDEQDIDEDKQFHVVEVGGVRYKTDRDYDDGKKYRVRGVYFKTNRDSWVTTVWRDTRLEAIMDLDQLRQGAYKDARILVMD